MAAGLVRKMKSELDTPVRYAMRLGGDTVSINNLIGDTFGLRFTGKLACVRCGRDVKKHYGQGFCFPCFRDAPENSPCIIRPELCEAHLGKGRDPEWEREHHDKPHVVYLSFTGAIKVGVTRAAQVPTRWIDQGATMAIPIARVPHRRMAGELEVKLKSHFSDKTNWRNMIKGVDASPEALLDAREVAIAALSDSEREHVVEEDVTMIKYPGEVNIPQVKSIKMDKVQEISATLVAVRGQYLVWGDGRVVNVRSHSGYELELL